MSQECAVNAAKCKLRVLGHVCIAEFAGLMPLGWVALLQMLGMCLHCPAAPCFVF